MSMKNFQELTNGQDIRDAGNFDTWAHRASNDASDFFRSQSRNHGIDRESQHLLTSLEITPIFTSHNSFQAGRGAFQPDRFMDGLRRLDPDLSDVVTPCPPGFDRARWYGGDKSPEYTLARGMANSLNELSSIPDAASRKTFVERVLQNQVPELEKQGAKVHGIQGERIKIDFGNGRGPQWIDTVRDLYGSPEVQLLNATALMRNQEGNGRVTMRPQVEPGRFPIDNTGDNGNYMPKYPVDQALPPCPPGFDATKWNNGHDTIKYAVGRDLARVFDQLKAIPDEAGQKKFAENFLKSQVPAMEARGGKVLAIKDEKVLLDAGEGSGPLWIDVVKDIGGKNPEVQWTVIGKGNPGQTEAPEFAPCPPGFDPVKWDNGHDTPKYFVGHLVADMLQQDRLNPDREGQKARVEKFLKEHAPLMQAKGIKVYDIIGEKIMMDVGDGTGKHWVDTVADVGGKNPQASWQVEA